MSCNCGSGTRGGAGPFSEGRDLVEFVMNAHGGSVAVSRLSNGGLETRCQECSESFLLDTFVKSCPSCGAVHAVSPPRANDPEAVQWAGKGFRL